MANTQVLNVTSLDRPTIRQDLINFLSSQSVFRDYDFAGSNLSVLIDLLAYVTNKQAFLINMLFSEAFLDSSQLMSSVVSHAKELNYVPRSTRSSVANVTVTFQATGESQPYLIQKGSSFSTLVKNTQYVYTVPETLVVSSPNTSFSFSTPIYEGEFLKDGYAYVPTTDVPYPAFRISNPGVDTTSLTVVVFEDDQVLGTTYTLATSLLDIDSTSAVYFLQCTTDGVYEVLFGDGVVGRQPATGATVLLDYRVASGPGADSATRFAINFDPTGANEASNIQVVATGTSTGGAVQESMGSIKYYAPRWYQAQERAVTPTDYETLLRVQFPEIAACTAYGGEDANPPLFGRVVVSVWVPGFTTIPASRKSAYTQFLTQRMTTGMEPAWVDPLFTWVQVDTTVDFDVSVTANTPQRIESLVTNAITEWNQAELGDFAAQLLYSPFCDAITAADPSITSNETVLTPYKKLSPTLGGIQTQTLDFQMPLVDDLPPTQYPHAQGQQCVVTSAPYVWNGLTVRLEDDGAGSVLVVQDSGDQTSSIQRVGTVDYATGLVTATFEVDSLFSATLPVYARAKSLDLASQKNTVLGIEAAGINVTPNPITK